MVSVRAQCERRDDRNIVHFTEASLVTLENAAYFELGKAEVSGRLECAFCSKKTSHEHEFVGRLKFDSSREKYFISCLTETVPRRSTASTSVRTKTLDIFPVQPGTSAADKTQVQREKEREPDPVSKASRVYPIFCTNEADAVRTLHQMMLQSKKCEVVAFKIHVNKELVVVKWDEVQHVHQATKEQCSICEDYSNFDSIESLVTHHLEHGIIKIKLKRLDDDTPASASSPDQAALVHANKPADGESTREKPSSVISYAKGRITCTKCNLVFGDNAAAISHANETHAKVGETLYQCELCLHRYKSKTTYKKHWRGHHKVRTRDHQCDLCGKKFLRPQHLQDHLLGHIGGKQHRCSHCDKKYSTVSSLTSHMVNAHNVGERPKCDDCGKSFYNTSQLNRHHLVQHRRDPDLRCPHCGHFYMRKDHLEEHVQTFHACEGNNKDLTCNLCDAKFRSIGGLATHKQQTHGELPWNASAAAESEKLECKVCEHVFLPQELETHLRFSHGVLPLAKPGVSEAAEALLRTLTPQPDYLLRCLTPLPLDSLDDLIT